MKHKPYYRDVRRVIRRYPYYCGRLAEMKAHSGDSLAVSSGTISNPTERLALLQLPDDQQREYEAVRRAVEKTKQLPTATARLLLIRLKYWERYRYDLTTAAMVIHYSPQQAWRFHVEFEALVAHYLNYGDCEG